MRLHYRSPPRQRHSSPQKRLAATTSPSPSLEEETTPTGRETPVSVACHRSNESDPGYHGDNISMSTSPVPRRKKSIPTHRGAVPATGLHGALKRRNHPPLVLEIPERPIKHVHFPDDSPTDPLAVIDWIISPTAEENM